MRKTIITCDIDKCNREIKVIPHKEHVTPEINKPKIYTVVFTTNQTDGASCVPYTDNKRLDLCDECLEKLILGNVIYARGVQGYNNYYFKDMPISERSPIFIPENK